MLIVHRAERADRLIGPLTEVLLAAPNDPLLPEVIAVPSRGVERWVSQQLALSLGAAGGQDGVAANIEFPLPAQLIGEVLARAVDLTADEDPWVGPRLVWGLLEVIDLSAAEPWAERCSITTSALTAPLRSTVPGVVTPPRRWWPGSSRPTTTTARPC
jgi:exodeoxyribonuclease V gamma subunit